jgi:peptide deformylase
MTVREILKIGDPRLLRQAQAVPQDAFDSDALMYCSFEKS